MSKPFETYFGGKEASGTYQKIINEIRPHDVYLELFLGGGAIFRHKKEATMNHLNDANPEVIREFENSFSKDNNVFTISSAINFLKEVKFKPYLQYCIYLDPPYPHSSRKSRHRYKFEMSDDEHRELLSIIKTLPQNVDVLISTYENDIYKEELSGWRLIKFMSQTRKGLREEYLYMNYENPEGFLHDYSFLGVDNIDRLRIKRKIKGKVEQLRRLPAKERNAILTALNESHRL